MTAIASVSRVVTEFDKFLFAPIGEDKNGMLLSVLSALARLDVDPWQEAAALTRLLGDAAVRRLTSLIAALPDLPSARLEPGVIADRLVALLPRRAGPHLPTRATALTQGTATQSLALLCAIFVAFLLGAMWIMARR